VSEDDYHNPENRNRNEEEASYEMDRKSKWNHQWTSYSFGAHISFAFARAKSETEHRNAYDRRDTGWDDCGAYSGGGIGLGHSTPNVDRLAQEGDPIQELARTSKLRTAGRASFMTGRIPIRSALSVPLPLLFLRKEMNIEKLSNAGYEPRQRTDRC
jgi:hypothetical protein